MTGITDPNSSSSTPPIGGDKPFGISSDLVSASPIKKEEQEQGHMALPHDPGIGMPVTQSLPQPPNKVAELIKKTNTVFHDAIDNSPLSMEEEQTDWSDALVELVEAEQIVENAGAVEQVVDQVFQDKIYSDYLEEKPILGAAPIKISSQDNNIIESVTVLEFDTLFLNSDMNNIKAIFLPDNGSVRMTKYMEYILPYMTRNEVPPPPDAIFNSENGTLIGQDAKVIAKNQIALRGFGAQRLCCASSELFLLFNQKLQYAIANLIENEKKKPDHKDTPLYPYVKPSGIVSVQDDESDGSEEVIEEPKISSDNEQQISSPTVENDEKVYEKINKDRLDKTENDKKKETLHHVIKKEIIKEEIQHGEILSEKTKEREKK